MTRMVHLVSVHDEFHARVIAARLGSDGIPTELRPPLGGPYPLRGEVRVYVGEGDLPLARDLLQADADQAGAPLTEELLGGADDADDAGDQADLVPARPLLTPGARVALAVLVLVPLLLLALSRAG